MLFFFGNVSLLLLLFCDGGRLSKRVIHVYAFMYWFQLRSKVTQTLLEAVNDYNEKESAREIMIHVQAQVRVDGCQRQMYRN